MGHGSKQVSLYKRISVLALAILVLLGAPARSADRPSFIRDAEIENSIRVWATPLFVAAGLNPGAVRIHLVKDNTLNAFVAAGQNLFLNTGLLVRTENVSQLIGVIAHETGHIAGGHLARMDEALKNASTEALIAMVLAGAAAAASGRADVGSAILMGGSSVAERSLLSFTRTQETAADQAAVSLLDATGQSSKGLLEFMEILGDQELLVTERQDPYVRTHPITSERISFLRNHANESHFTGVQAPPEYAEMHRRMRAKLFSFLELPARTLQRYREEDESLESRYARAIAHYRKPDLARALPLVEDLLAERPADPYFQELKGQILFENGRAPDALAAYQEAVRLLPNSPLLRISLAQVEIELNQPPLLEDAVGHLNFALTEEADNGFAWRLLAIAQGRRGNEGEAAFAMAEYAMLGGQIAEALHHATRAEKLLPRGSPSWLRVQDVKAQAMRLREERKR